jgi:hypothetical protein
MKFPFSMPKDCDFISILLLWLQDKMSQIPNSNNLIIFNNLSITRLLFLNLQLLGYKNIFSK